ncbi:MAG: hypothetical protein J7484_09150 [Microbacterium sp.]|nr:hypothetical protein [Microbacterium sp.]
MIGASAEWKEHIMSDAGETIDDLTPTADRVEQNRPVVDEPGDPESVTEPAPLSEAREVDIADAMDQREEVPLDEDLEAR